MDIEAAFLEDGTFISTEYAHIESMHYHAAKGEGDKHYVDTFYVGGYVTRNFNIKQINYKLKEPTSITSPDVIYRENY